MVKISESEWFCNHCKSSAFPEVEQLRSKSKITTPIGLNLEPCLSYLPEPSDLSKKLVEIKGGLKALKDRGIKITSYRGLRMRAPLQRVHTCAYCGPGITHLIDPSIYPE